MAHKRFVPGWKRDTHDERDVVYAVKAPVALPPVVDLRSEMPPVYDQGALGSCTSNAICAAMQYLDMQTRSDDTMLSRLFVYYNERAMEGTIKQDAGAMIRDGIKSLNKQGVCAEKTWPYVIAKFKAKPPAKAYAEAVRREITAYQRIVSLNDMLQCVAAGHPFVFGFAVYDSFESQMVAQTGIVNLPRPGERLLGGHAVLAVGYDQSTQRFLVRNSWGTEWGQAGYFTMPFAYLTNPKLADDMWMMTK